MFGVHRVLSFQITWVPNSVGMGRWWSPRVASTCWGVNPPQSTSLGDAEETSLPLANDKFRFSVGLSLQNKPLGLFCMNKAGTVETELLIEFIKM